LYCIYTIIKIFGLYDSAIFGKHLSLSVKPYNMSKLDHKGKKKFETEKKSGESITLDVVAKIAGVSAITVSRAINKPDKVAPATLEKVQNAITQTGYVPNLLAGGLASRSSKLIAAIVPSIANLVYSSTIRLFSNFFRKAGYQVILGDSGYPEILEEELVQTILSRRPDGILLTGVDHSPCCRNLLLAANIPIVETWDLTPSPLDIVVGFNHIEIGHEVAKFILKKGYKKVGFVTGNDSRALLRQRATLEVLGQNNISSIYPTTVPAPTSMELGRVGVKQILEEGFDKGVIFCSSDTLAQGVLAELQSRHISIPEEVAVIGFGDQLFAAFTYPALTTVRIDRERIGQEAADTLLARIQGRTITNRIIDIGFSIVERDST
jgi:LacI family gluconate utilization system Gnt-I transcriptional repressor